jgi:hypothetical protein
VSADRHPAESASVDGEFVEVVEGKVELWMGLSFDVRTMGAVV